MKYNKVFHILALALILSLLMLAIPASPALALTGVIDITSPATATGPPGTSVTLSCSDFTPNSTYVVYFGGVATTFTGSTTGDGNFTAVFTVPTSPKGVYDVTVITDAPDDSNTESFTVTPQITLSSSSGNVSDTFTVSGNGFTASATGGYVWFDIDGDYIRDSGEPYLSATTSSSGVLSASGNITVPEVPKGTYYVRVEVPYDATADADASASYAVSPEIELDPTSGAVDDEVTVNGTGFADDSDIEVFFDNVGVDITSDDDKTDDDGSFECTFDVPEASRGSHTVKVKDEDENDATATFTVGQKIIIDPTSGSSSTIVTVTGTGFRADRAITVYYNDVDITDDITGDEETDSDGSFEFTFAVPTGSAGTYEIEVTDGSYSATADFESTTDATISETTTEADPGHVGMELTITGTGFTPDSTVTVIYASTTKDLGTFDTDENGDFEADITIPASEGGAHTITVTDDTDETITKSFNFYMEKEAPSAPSLLLPAVGTKLGEEGFAWGIVTDDSEPVTYDLQVATDATFSTKLLDKTGLTTLAYTLLETEELEKTSKDEPYYWQVRAVDAASNVGEWSSVGTFHVGSTFQITGWVMWVIMVVIAVVFFLVGLLVGRRAGGGGGF